MIAVAVALIVVIAACAVYIAGYAPMTVEPVLVAALPVAVGVSFLVIGHPLVAVVVLSVTAAMSGLTAGCIYLDEMTDRRRGRLRF